ncbi:MAG: hypothetical protein VSS75_023495, partial [Candidatus Parabeggiatoa sp.]|nr:hypothetical protein [Candidatus Parabeggiatoa sp.]
YFTMDRLYAAYQKHQSHQESSLKPFFFFRKEQTFSQAYFAKIHYHWQRHSSLSSDKFIDKLSLQAPENPIGEEVFEYGVERIIVVDEPLTVDLFVKNNKHLNKKAVIISSEGYPAYLKPHLQTLLQKQPNIKIGFLHKRELTIEQQIRRFEQKYEVILKGSVWDISTKQKYTKPVQSGEALKDNLQTILLSVDETHSKKGHSWLSWMIPTSITSVFGIPITSAGKETEEKEAEPEMATDHFEADSDNDSGGYSDDDAGFDGLDASEDDSEGGADDDGE